MVYVILCTAMWYFLTPVGNCFIFLASAAFPPLLFVGSVLAWGLMDRKSIAPTIPESDPAAVLAFAHSEQFTFR